MDEYVGPSRDQWSEEDLKLAQAVLDLLPPGAKLGEKVNLPIEQNDPSEAVRSAEIPTFLRRFFDIIAWRPYGGQIVDLVLPLVRNDWALSEIGFRCVQAMLDIEDYELRTRPAANHHIVAVGRLKALPRLFRPLGKQVLQALSRRARRLRNRA